MLTIAALYHFTRFPDPAALAATDIPRERVVALTYDDTAVTRGRLSEMVGMTIVKPPCREMLRHPALGASEQP